MNMHPPQSSDVVIEDLSLSFGETEVLKGINLHIRAGEFFSFLGPSGSGKSTLLRAIAGFGPTPKGRILIGSEDIAKLPPWERNVGMVFQSYALWPHMSVAKNVAFGLEERKLPRAEINTRVMEALELVDMAEYAQRRPSQLSGGQQQRVALARTIVIEPRVLLLDEPLSNLDANLRVQMRRDILALQRKLGLTTIFVTHDQEEANTTSDRMAVLNDGILQQVGSPMTLYDEPANKFVAGFLGTANIFKGHVETTGRTNMFVSEKGTKIKVADKGKNATLIVFRPQNAEILPPEESCDKDRICFDGKVSEVEFLGNILRYKVESGGEAFLVDHNHQPGEHVFAVSDRVKVELNPDQIIFLDK